MLDSSDVVVHVLDARDPMGTMCKPVLDFLKKEKAHKGVVFVLNKVDLVPTWVTVSSRVLSLLASSLLSFPYIFAPRPSQVLQHFSALSHERVGITLRLGGLLRPWKTEPLLLPGLPYGEINSPHPFNSVMELADSKALSPSWESSEGYRERVRTFLL